MSDDRHSKQPERLPSWLVTRLFSPRRIIGLFEIFVVILTAAVSLVVVWIFLHFPSFVRILDRLGQLALAALAVAAFLLLVLAFLERYLRPSIRELGPLSKTVVEQLKQGELGPAAKSVAEYAGDEGEKLIAWFSWRGIYRRWGHVVALLLVGFGALIGEILISWQLEVS
ncbi:MAG: hypothetical protein MI919_14015, partial [Holophagales bacterium]|nr:hypothetical protein [Holophagales bacterium]